MFGLGGAEIALILLFGFLIFGPDKLPAIARTVGRVMRQFRTAQEQMNKVIQAEVYDPLKDLEPLANPFSGLNLEDALLGKKGSGDTKAALDKAKASDKKDSSVASTVATAAPGDAAKPEEKKVSSDALKAALAAESTKAKKQASEKSQAQAAASQQTSEQAGESFAQRRARMEQAHAESKAKAAAEASEATLVADPAPALAASPEKAKD